MATYTTIQHPTSGETYAVELDESGEIIRAAGPLYHGDPADEDSLYEAIANNTTSADEDAVWLRREIEQVS